MLYVFVSALVLSFVPAALCIVGGDLVNIEQYPWQAGIMYLSQHHCGGSIIGKKWVLTSASCASVKNQLSVDCGSAVLGEEYNYDVIVYIIHEQYGYGGFFNDFDIAVLKINGIFMLSSKVQIVPLAMEKREPGSKVRLSGWGSLTENLIFTPDLRAVEVEIISKSECRRSHVSQFLTDRMICAGLREGGKDGCYGDGGGPLVHSSVQVGILSFGDGCGRPGKPSIYTDVVSLRPWILANI